MAGYFPSLSFNADYGAGGAHPSTATQVFDVRGTLTIPIFQGGSVHGDILQADARLEQSRERLDNLRAQIDSDVRAALLNLQSSADLVNVARSNIDLAEQTLAQSRDRFSAGVTDTVEVVQSQEAVASAHEQYISSLYSYNFAKISLARALGVAEAGRQGIFQRKINMADENPPRSAPEAGKDSPIDPSLQHASMHEDRNRAAAYPESQAPQKPLILIVILVLLVGGIFLWRYLSSYESTDDAQGDVHLYPVSARISGYVVKVNVDDNQWVQQGTVLVEIDPKDYEVAVAQAQANLASAEATAQSLNITVPITSVNTTSQLKSTASDIENANAGITAAERQLTAAHAQLEAGRGQRRKGAGRSPPLQAAGRQAGGRRADLRSGVGRGQIQHRGGGGSHRH